MRWSTLSSMNSEILIPGYPTRVTPVEPPKTYRISSTSLNTVGASQEKVLQALLTPSVELSIAPHLNHQLVPSHLKQALASKGLDIDNFHPLSKDQMIARLD